LAQWVAEARYQLLSCIEDPDWPGDERRIFVRINDALAKLGSSLVTDRLMRQHLGAEGPKVLPNGGDFRVFRIRSGTHWGIKESLSIRQHESVCAAGYLLVKAAMCYAGFANGRPTRDDAKETAAAILEASQRLYGHPLPKVTVTLTEAVTGIKLTPSSVRRLAHHPPPV
jgi:hypothetical protein